MKHAKLIILIIVFNIHQHPSPAQNKVLDSLQQKLTYVNDTLKAKVLCMIGQEFLYASHNADSAISYVQRALDLSRENNYDKGIGYSNHLLGASYSAKNYRTTALYYYRQNLGLSATYPDYKKLKAVTHLEIGKIYYVLAQETSSEEMFNQALKHYREFYKVSQKVKKEPELHTLACDVIANLFLTNDQYDSALKYFEKASKLSWEKGLEVKSLINIAKLWERKKEKQNALEKFRRAVQVITESNAGTHFYPKETLLSEIYQSMAAIFLESDELDSARYYLDKVVEQSALSRDKLDIASALIQNSFLLYREKKFDQSLQTLNVALTEVKKKIPESPNIAADL